LGQYPGDGLRGLLGLIDLDEIIDNRASLGEYAGSLEHDLAGIEAEATEVLVHGAVLVGWEFPGADRGESADGPAGGYEPPVEDGISLGDYMVAEAGLVALYRGMR